MGIASASFKLLRTPILRLLLVRQPVRLAAMFMDAASITVGFLLASLLAGNAVAAARPEAPAIANVVIDESESDILVPPVLRSAFGFAIAVDADTLVVGARNDDEIADNAGAAYVFVHDGENWQFQAKLTAADGESGDRFGSAVDVSGDFIVVGAPAAVGAAGPIVGGGAAYVFKRDGTTWTQDARLVGTLTVSTDPFDTPGNDNFGRAVAINGDVPAESTDDGFVYNVIVGAPFDNHSQTTDAGSAFLFQLSADGTAWNEAAKLIANDPIGASGFGRAVDLDGDHMIIGAHNFGDGAYIFVRRGSQGVWGLETKVDGSGGDFGIAVAAFARSGRATFAVGAPLDNELATSSGAVYVLEGSTQPFAQQKLFAAGQGGFDRFGSDVAVLDGRVLATATTAPDNVGTNTGAAYLFKDRAGAWEQTHRFLGTGASRMEAIAAGGDFALVGDQSYPTSLMDGLVFVFDGLDLVHSDGFESP